MVLSTILCTHRYPRIHAIALLTLASIAAISTSSFACEGHNQEPLPPGAELKPHPSIHIAPKNSANLDTRVNHLAECSYPGIDCIVGTPTYTHTISVDDGEYYNHMTIVSEHLVSTHGAFEHKKSLGSVKKFLEAEFEPNTRLYQSYLINAPKQDLARVFDDCTDYACPVVSELPGVVVPGTEASRAVISMDGQDLLGQPHVRIYAKKGRHYLQMDGDLQIPYEKLTESILKPCMPVERQSYKDDPETGHLNTQSALYCAGKAIRESAEIQTLAREKADELIKTFAIE